jgi:hypothetical protein
MQRHASARLLLVFPSETVGRTRRSMLRCEECDVVAVGDAGGWSAYRFRDPDHEEKTLVVVYCPDCAQRELGDGPQRER